LLRALETRNGGAVKDFKRLREALTQTYGRDAVNTLAQFIDSLRFHSAADLLREVLNSGDKESR